MPEDNPAFGEVVRRHFNLNFVPRGDADEVLAHLATDVGKDFMAVFKLNPVHGGREHLIDDTVNLNEVLIFFGWHTNL